MSVYTGQDGSISVGGTALLEVTSFSIEHTVNTIETSAMGDDYRSHLAGLAEWSGSADIYWDTSEVTNADFVDGSSVAIIAYPGGNTSGYAKLSGNATITGFSINSELEGVVSASVSFQGNGALTIAAATGS